MPAKKSTDRKASPKKAMATRKTTARKTATAPGPAVPARPGDLIVIDSTRVGSPAREGEVLEVIQGDMSVSYRVQWSDGHQSLFAPIVGSARIVPASDRA